MKECAIRAAAPGDENAIVALLLELAAYEKLTDGFRLTAGIVARDFIGPATACGCALAFLDGAPIGVMTWHPTYSSFAAARGIYLQDLFVRPAFRGRGFGRALLAYLARHALARNAPRIEWSVLDWNKPSISFYEMLRAEPVSGWVTYRVTGPALAELAAS